MAVAAVHPVQHPLDMPHSRPHHHPPPIKSPPESAASRAAAAAAAAGKPMKPPAQCPYCGMTFRKLEHCQRHERTHTLDRPYACSVCAKTFARQDTLNRHVRLHTRSDEGVASKPRRRRIKPANAAASTSPVIDAQASPRPNLALPLPSPSTDDFQMSVTPSRRSSASSDQPIVEAPADLINGHARHRGLSLSAVERTEPMFSWQDTRHHSTGPHRPLPLFDGGDAYQRRPPDLADTSLLAQYRRATTNPFPSRPALFISTEGHTSTTIPAGLPTAPAAIHAPGWTAPWSYSSPAHPGHLRTHSLGPDTFADIEHPLLAARKHDHHFGANAFGLSGVGADHGGESAFINGEGFNWAAYQHHHPALHLPQPAHHPFDHQAEFMATAAAANGDALAPSPPQSSAGSSRGRAESSSVGSQPSTGLLRNGSLPRGGWAQPMLVPGGGGAESGTEGSLASSLETDVSSKSAVAFDDPTLASADLARTLSSHAPAYFEHHQPAPFPGSEKQPPSEHSYHHGHPPDDAPALRLGDAVDEWRRMFPLRPSGAVAAFEDDEVHPPSVDEPAAFLPLLDAHRPPHPVVAHPAAAAAPDVPMIDASAHPHPPKYNRHGFIARGEPQVAVQVLESPAPSIGLDAGARAGASTTWLTTPGESPLSTMSSA